MPPGSRTTDFRDAIARLGRPRCVDRDAERSQVDNRNHRRRQHRKRGCPVPRRRGRARRLGREGRVTCGGARANELGPLARAASVEDAIADADVVVFALWLDTIKELIAKDARLLDDKVVVDPSNPLGFDASGQIVRTLPDDQSAGSIVASLLPAGAHYVKAFGTLSAEALGSNANRKPQPAVLFYATDDDAAATTVERLIRQPGSSRSRSAASPLPYGSRCPAATSTSTA